MSGDREVLVVSRRAVETILGGAIPPVLVPCDGVLAALLAAAEWRPRAAMEEDPSFKQLIPYVAFVAGGHVFTYARGRSGGEARLHSLRSVGVGGHVEPGAGPRVPMVAYVESLARELAEEVRLPGGGAIPVPPPAALLDDESTPVGRVHLGVLHVARLAVPDLEAAEDDLADPRFADLAGLAADPAGYEEWSRLALPVLAGLARTPPPAAGSGRDRNG